jgi:hypothetical protein
MKKSALIAVVVPTIVAALAVFPLENSPKRFHTPSEIASFERAKSMLTDPGGVAMIDSNILFPTAKTCRGCHGHDQNMIAFITFSGEDVNIYDDWRSNMMANSAKDPFWRAKVTHEILVNPAHSLALQDKCTSCHAPAGHYQAKLKGQAQHYLLSDLYADSLGLDGVTCQACHAQSPALIGSLHSGNLNFDLNKIRVAYGPYQFVFAPPMHTFVGITPLYGEHITEAGLCAGCHTLITETVDLQGQLTGQTFVEQATYHEWLNSRYDAEKDNITCQSCHMPRIDDAVVISANYQFLAPKYPFGLHDMAGANVTMLQLMKDNRQTLGIDAEAVHYDSTIAATLRMLQQKTLDLELKNKGSYSDTMRFSLRLLNKTGHKFPSGYPSRRAWVELEVRDQSGQTIFHSGKAAPDHSLPDEDATFEPHHQVIRSPQQVQIYEIVPADVTGKFTTLLERAATALKDNRLPPQGFRKNHPVYDTTRIYGVDNDPDFNLFPDGEEGSGADVVHFHLPSQGYTGYVSVRAKVWYQSLPPKWMAPMFDFNSPEIDAFRAMFDSADRSPVLIGETSLDSVFLSTVSVKNTVPASTVRVFPSYSQDGRVFVETSGSNVVTKVSVWDAAGRLVFSQNGWPNGPLELPRQSGVYLIAVETKNGRTVAKVVRGQ